MKAIRVVLDGGLVKSVDRAARRLKVNRSALVRDAVREHLERLHYRELEQKEREGYGRIPDDPAEFAVWDKLYTMSGNSLDAWNTVAISTSPGPRRYTMR